MVSNGLTDVDILVMILNIINIEYVHLYTNSIATPGYQFYCHRFI